MQPENFAIVRPDTLYLTVEEKAFDVMHAGEKKYEFREPGWWIESRLFNAQFRYVKFTLGYAAVDVSPAFVTRMLGWRRCFHVHAGPYSNGLVVTGTERIVIKLGPVVWRINIPPYPEGPVVVVEDARRVHHHSGGKAAWATGDFSTWDSQDWGWGDGDPLNGRYDEPKRSKKPAKESTTGKRDQQAAERTFTPIRRAERDPAFKPTGTHAPKTPAAAAAKAADDKKKREASTRPAAIVAKAVISGAMNGMESDETTASSSDSLKKRHVSPAPSLIAQRRQRITYSQISHLMPPPVRQLTPQKLAFLAQPVQQQQEQQAFYRKPPPPSLATGFRPLSPASFGASFGASYGASYDGMMAQAEALRGAALMMKDKISQPPPRGGIVTDDESSLSDVQTMARRVTDDNSIMAEQARTDTAKARADAAKARADTAKARADKADAAKARADMAKARGRARSVTDDDVSLSDGPAIIMAEQAKARANKARSVTDDDVSEADMAKARADKVRRAGRTYESTINFVMLLGSAAGVSFLIGAFVTAFLFFVAGLSPRS